MKMPFGKYKGKEIEEIPSWYLKWAAENLSQDHLATVCDREWQWREKHNSHIEE